MISLTTAQLITITQCSLYLDTLEPLLPQALQVRWLEFQQRVSNMRQGYTPTDEEELVNGLQSHLPTQEEAQALFGEAYLALKDPDDKAVIRSVMGRLGLTPSAPAPGDDRTPGRP